MVVCLVVVRLMGVVVRFGGDGGDGICVCDECGCVTHLFPKLGQCSQGFDSAEIPLFPNLCTWRLVDKDGEFEKEKYYIHTYTPTLTQRIPYPHKIHKTCIEN